MKPYMQWLSHDERAACQRQGIILKMASLKVDPAKVNPLLEKAAQGSGFIPGVASMGLRGVLLGSLLGGIPLGLLAHAMHQSVAKKSRKEREKEEKIRFLQDVTRELETGLSDRGVRV